MSETQTQKPATRKRKRKPKFTTAFQFTPSMLVSTAATDIRRRWRNVMRDGVNTERLAAGLELTPVERYAFHPGDIRTSKTPADVLRKAIRRVLGDKTTHTQKNRILLYGDIKLLKAALDLAQTREAANVAP